MFGSLRQRLFRPSLMLATWRGSSEITQDRRAIAQLAGATVWLAMSYGATKLQIGAKAENGITWMKMFGPWWYRHGNWWELVGPDAPTYAFLLQLYVSIAELNAALPIGGTIPAIKERRRLRLEFRLFEDNSIELGWDRRHASVREEAGTTYPDEENTDEIDRL